MKIDRAQQGKPMRLRASDWNAIASTVEKINKGTDSGSGINDPLAKKLEGEVLVKNTTGSTLPRYSALIVETMIIKPSDNEKAFLSQYPLFEGANTYSDIKFSASVAILQEPAKNNKLALAKTSGSTIAKVNVESEDDMYAFFEDGETVLKTGLTGTMKILWKESGTGEKWAVVHLDNTIGIYDSPVDLTYENEHEEAARDGKKYQNEEGEDVIWDRRKYPDGESGCGLKITQSLGAAYYDSGDQTLYQYVADFHYDASGCLVMISPERRVTIETPESCED